MLLETSATTAKSLQNKLNPLLDI